MKNYRRIEALIPHHWTEGTINANGIVQHFYRTGGNHPPLILLHGLMAGALTWMRVAQGLETEYDILIVDARGHGHSERIHSGFSTDLLVEDVASLIPALNLDKPRLLGHSMGGTTAALLAARYPDLIRSLVLEESVWGDQAGIPPAVMQSEGYQAWLKTYVDYLRNLKTQNHTERMVAGLAQLPPGSGIWPEEEFVPMVKAQSQLDLELVTRGPELWSAMQPGAPLAELVRRITCPILLLTGGHGNCDPRVVEQVLAASHNGEHVNFENAGHLVHLDEFDRFISVVKAFYKDRG
ncbi:MAG TPA: alpha/beta hydrolase [Anaerolineae bacterium]